MLVQVVLFDGFDPLDVVAPYEILGTAMTAELVSAEGPRDVPSGNGLLSLRAVSRLDPTSADIVVVPGALGPLPDGIPTILAATLSTPLPALLAEAMSRPECTVATVCGGSMILGMAGLIEGRHATTHRLGLDALAANGVQVVGTRVVDDGDLVSSSSVTCGIDLALYLLERELGPEVALETERMIAHERRGTVWRAAWELSRRG
ncbi:DJ-1/PfpI family protein [Kutzneria buriramensis]|uniref:DJ-1/PfpI family protein n=1 Tax=Kutzneria buriramensis TaxID=1045776 RepID=A0A3E0HF35_9PSEU|nr:DJ-1/PfpI family protein [Kutzneria buriramensis]REH43807.1 DJ-1/PfpI family protein [Kutzneria buriramensis]